MDVAVRRVLVSGWGPRHPQISVTGPSLLVNCYLGDKFHKKSGWFISTFIVRAKISFA